MIIKNKKHILNCAKLTFRFLMGISVATLSLHSLADENAYISEYGRGSVAVVNLTTYEIIKSIKSGTSTWGVALDSPRQRVYVTNIDSDDVTVIDTNKLEVVAKIDVERNPVGLSVLPNGNDLPPITLPVFIEKSPFKNHVACLSLCA